MKRKSLFIAIILITGGGYFAYEYVYKDHRDISTEQSVVELGAEELVNLFKNNAGDHLFDKTITITGLVSEVESNNLTIDNAVHCTFTSLISEYQINDALKIKGRCIGYDDLFEVIKLDQCTILK